MKKLRILCLFITVAVLFLAEAPVQAALMMKLETSPSQSIVIIDNQVGDTNPLPGIIGYTGSLGNWMMTSSVGLGSGAIPSGQLHLDSVTLSGQASAIDIYLSETDLSIPLRGWTLDAGGVLAAQGSALFEAYFGADNTAFGGTNFADLNFNALPAQHPFAGSDTGYVALDALYTLTLKARITHAGGISISSFNAQLTPVPVPPSLLMLGTGLVGFIFLRRNRNSEGLNG